MNSNSKCQKIPVEKNCLASKGNYSFKFTLKDSPFHFLLNQFYKMVDRLGYDKAITFMEAVYPEWTDHWEDVMLAYDYEFNNLKRGVE